MADTTTKGKAKAPADDTQANTIFSYVKTQETVYALPITVIDGWEWNMKEHIRISTLYKNSQFARGNSEAERDGKPFKNIVRPLLNFQYRSEGFDVKDIKLYVDDSEQYYKSFIVNKAHDQWALDNDIETMINDGNESVVDYGGALFRNTTGKKPEVVPLTTIAFCDQTNILSGPFAIKHFFGPDKMQEMKAVGWGDAKNGADITIQEAIDLAKSSQVPDDKTGTANKTPGKYVEIYEVHGMMPASWLNDNGDPDIYVRQMQIITFYMNKDGQKVGRTLFKGPAQKGLFMVMLRDKIPGRALGYGGVEELFDPQVWANYSEITIAKLLEAASKIIFKTTDTTLKSKNAAGLKNLDNGEIVELAEGHDVEQISTTPVNMELFQSASQLWNEQAKDMASATGATAGISPGQKTSFNALSLLTQQGLALHQYRQGKYAYFMGKVYQDWVLPAITKDLMNGKKFLAELSLKELQQVSKAVIECQMNDVIKKKILNGEEIIPSDMANVKQGLAKNFAAKGNKHFLELFKNEMKDIPTVVHISIKDKQKDLTAMANGIRGIIAQIIAAPGILQQPGMSDLFNQIIEASGLNPIDFSSTLDAPPPTPPQQPTQPVQPQQTQPQLPQKVINTHAVGAHAY